MSDNILRLVDREFSLGITYYEIMDLSKESLNRLLVQIPRDELIDWLQWNDPNGVHPG